MFSLFPRCQWLIAVIMVIGIAPGCSAHRSTMPQISLLRRDAIQRPDTVGEWNDWADAQLRDGDIVFMRGDCYVLMGTVNFSAVSTDLTASRFSHVGLVAIEHGEAHVYDLRNQGCLRTRFGELLAHRQLHQVAIKRHRDASPNELARTATFCQSVFVDQEKYDDQLKLNNGRLYCTELVEEAYRHAGYSLSEPVPIHDLPNYARHARTIGFVRAVTGIEPDQPVLLPGNEQFGVWANPDLELILDLPDTKVRPSADHTARGGN